MEKFAKLYERDGRQVLVTKEESDDGSPQINFRSTTLNSGHSITLKMGYKDADWDVMDVAFERVCEDFAFGVIEGSPGSEM